MTTMTLRSPSCLALTNDSVMVFSMAKTDERFDFLKPTVPPVTVPFVLNAVSAMLHLVLFHELLIVITPETLRRGFMPPCRTPTIGSSSRADGAPTWLSPAMLLELRARVESRPLSAGAPAAAAGVALLALPKLTLPTRASSGDALGAGSRGSSRKRETRPSDMLRSARGGTSSGRNCGLAADVRSVARRTHGAGDIQRTIKTLAGAAGLERSAER